MGIRRSAIGVFDSGVGGLSVMREIAKLLPEEEIIYFADSIHCPYGKRSLREIRGFSQGIVRFLLDQGAGVVVVACNTASAAALSYLREKFSVPIVGMEPAVKPAALTTRSGKVGVIATKVTFQGELFAKLIERFATNVEVYTQVCPSLVERVEAGLLDDPETEGLLRAYLRPMLKAGIDTLVLGCTHYSFLRRTIEGIVGPEVRVIDPCFAVARQTKRVFEREGLRGEGRGEHLFYTSGDPRVFTEMVKRLIGERGKVKGTLWEKLEGEWRLYPKSGLG